jgi:predicted metalloprotease
MRFNPKARLDTKRVSDRGRGRSGGGAGGGAMRLPIPSGAAAGGGLGGIIIVVLFLVLTQCVGSGTGGDALPDTGLDTGRIDAAESERYANCKTGEDANTDVDCARVAVENSLYDFWSETLPSQSDTEFRAQRDLTTFSGAVDTGCGNATSAVGPFYCPADQRLYIDPSFYDVMEKRLRAPGDFAQAYVIAHEVGHHVQNLIGSTRLQPSGESSNQTSVRVELQADCLAGVWGRSARSTLEITDEDLGEALTAAHAIGDDALGHSDERRFTHGSSEQRKRWFRRGFESGDARQCDTFAVRNYHEL